MNYSQFCVQKKTSRSLAYLKQRGKQDLLHCWGVLASILNESASETDWSITFGCSIGDEISTSKRASVSVPCFMIKTENCFIQATNNFPQSCFHQVFCGLCLACSGWMFVSFALSSFFEFSVCLLHCWTKYALLLLNMNCTSLILLMFYYA